MKKTVALVLVAVAVQCASAQDTVRLTLDSCLRYAYAHNYQVREAALGEKSAEVTLQGARMRFLPSVNASASQSLGIADQTTRNGSYGVNANLTLFSGLENVNNLRLGKLGTRQSALQLQQTENSVGIQIVSAYLTIMMNREKLAYQREVLATSQKQQEEGELKYKVGRILESDYLLLAANHTSATVEIENTVLTIDENRRTLHTLLGMDAGTVVDVVEQADSMKAADGFVPTYDAIMARAKESMPDWQLSQLGIDKAKLNVSIARASLMPTLSLGGNVAYNEGAVLSDEPTTTLSGGLNSSVTLGLSIPLLNRGASLTQVKQSKIALQQAEIENQQTIADLEDRIEELHLGALQALGRYRAAEALADAYRASYEVYAIKYGEGAVTTVEMLQQQDRYLSALNDYLQSKYSFILAGKQLDIYMGKDVK